MPGLRLALLGPPRIERDGAAVQVDTRKAIALLAHLTLTGEAQRRDALAALLWPDYDSEHARAALRRTLSSLNKALGGQLVADRASVGVDLDGAWVDVLRFRALVAACGGHGHEPGQVCHACLEPLEQAVALHRGEFLAGFSLRDSDTFEEWQFFQVETFRRELAGALERLVRCRAAEHQWEPAVADARRWLALDPLHEPAHRQLMRLYAWSGQRAAALRQYRECVRVLDQELGVAPLEETTALYQAVTENRLEPPPAPGPAEREAPAPATAPPRPAPGPPLVGRAAELRALVEAYEAAGPHGSLVAVEGEAGIGKTRLAEALLDHAERLGAATVAMRCYEDEGGLAYGPVVEGLRAALPHGGRAWPDALPAHALRELTRLLPELADSHPELEPAPPLDSPGAQTRFLDAVAAALLAAAGAGARPGLVFIDDLHWADEASLDVLTYLVRRLAGRPLCILLTWRSEQVPGGHRLRRLVADAQRGGRAAVLRLGRLGEGDVAELVRALAPAHADQAGALYSETEGLPFFLIEYVTQYLAPDGDGAEPALPGGVRELLRTRIAAVGETAQQVLAAGAVIGRSFDFETVREASGRGDEETVQALEELIGHGLVRELEAPGYDFNHEKVRALVYEETSLARRRLLHRRVAEALGGRSRRARDAGSLAGLVAHHLQLGGLDAEAAAAYALAGEHARALYANHEALAHYRAALALGHADPAGLQEAIADLETLLGNYDAALAGYERAAAEAEPDGLAAVEHKLGRLHHRRGDWEAAESHYHAALDAGPSPGRRARIYADWSLNAQQRGDHAGALELAGKALELGEAAADEQAVARAHNILGVLAGRLGDQAGALGHLERAVAMAERLPDPSARVASLNSLALALGAAGQLDEAVARASEALELCAAQGDRHGEAALHNNLADLLHAAGRSDEAMAHLKQAVAIFAEVGEPGRLQPRIWTLVEW